MKRNGLFLPIVVLIGIGIYFGVNFYKENATITTNLELHNTDFVEIIEKIPTDEVDISYKKTELEIEAIMNKTQIEELLLEYNALNLVTKTALLALNEETKVMLIFDINADNEYQFVLKQVTLGEIKIDTNIIIN